MCAQFTPIDRPPEAKRRRKEFLLNDSPPPSPAQLHRPPANIPSPAAQWASKEQSARSLAALSDVCSSAVPMTTAVPIHPAPAPPISKPSVYSRSASGPPTPSPPRCRCVDQLRDTSQTFYHAISTSPPDIALSYLVHIRTTLQNIQSCRIFIASQAAPLPPVDPMSPPTSESALASVNAVLSILGVVASALNATCLGLIPQLASTQHLSPSPPPPPSAGCTLPVSPLPTTGLGLHSSHPPTPQSYSARHPSLPPSISPLHSRTPPSQPPSSSSASAQPGIRATLSLGAYQPSRQLQNFLWGTALMYELESLLAIVRRFDLGGPASPASSTTSSRFGSMGRGGGLGDGKSTADQARARARAQIEGLFDETMSQLTLWVNVSRN